MSNLIVNLTHDVDRITKTYQYLTQDVRRGCWGNLKSVFSSKSPYWMFKEIIKIEESYGVRSTFFFLEESIPFRLWQLKNWFLSLGRYKFEDVKNIIKYLDNGGWEIGLHGSYNSYKDLSLLKKEKSKLENIVKKEIIGIRQHHLNLTIPNTWELQKQAGFLYDASYGKKRGTGFLDRNKPFINKKTGMFIIPLAFMEFNLMALANHDISKAKRILIEIIEEAEKKQSVLSVLWHQRMFNEMEFPGYYYLYEELIKEGKKRNAQFLTCVQIYQQQFSSIHGE